MRLAILLTRRSHLKVLSSVIDASLLRGHTTEIVCDVRAAKRGDTLNLKEVATLWPYARLARTLTPWHYDAVIGLEACLPETPLTKLVGVDHFYDCWIHPPRKDVTMCYHSDYHRATHHDLWGVSPYGGEVVGWLPGDQAHAMLEEPERDSAVFFALKRDVPEPWRQSREGKRIYYHVFCEAQLKAKAEGLRFIVKSRRKNADPWWLWWLADEIYYDDEMVPYTSLSLLQRAKWAEHFESGAGLEAALMGAYSIAIHVPQPHIIGLPGGRLQYGGVDMHEWPGVTQYGLHRWHDRRPVPSVDPEQRQKYLDHFVGACDGRAGERVVQIAEGRT